MALSHHKLTFITLVCSWYQDWYQHVHGTPQQQAVGLQALHLDAAACRCCAAAYGQVIM